MKFDEDIFTKTYFYILCYFDLTNRKIATVNLWSNGYRIFKNATCILKFKELKNIEFSPTMPPSMDKIFPFIDDNIIDNTRIITCFENFMKGSLILNGFIAHTLTPKCKDLKKQQKNRPIRISEVFTAGSFESINTKRKDDFEVTQKTINFSWMLNENYQKIINLPSELITILKEMNDTRNRLHFMSIEKYIISQNSISNILIVKDFAENIMAHRLRDLDSNLKQA